MRSSVFVLALCAASAWGQLTPARIPQTPDIHGDMIAFETEGDIFVGNLKTGEASRLTSWTGQETRPKFSHDGTQIAFTGTYDGRQEVYVIDVSGGIPKRLTYDPAGASIVDWMPDGKHFIFRSTRLSGQGDLRLFVGDLNGGGIPQPMPMPMAAQGSINPAGNLVAYTRIPLENHWWRHYKGGMANDIYLYNSTANTFSQITTDPINEQYPVFCGDRLFFVSEKAGTANLVEHKFKTGKEMAVTNYTTYDVQSPASDGKRIIFRMGLDLYVWDPAKPEVQKVSLKVASDMIHARAHTLAGSMGRFSLGPSGTRVLVEDRGQIFSAPSESGDIRPVASWPGSRNQMGQWSPNGKTIAFVSDKSDEENVWLTPAAGGEAHQLTRMSKMGIGGIQWSPDSKKIMLADNSTTLWLIDATTGLTEKIAQDEYGAPFSFSMSQDSRLITYVKADAFNQSSIWIYDTVTKKHTRITKAPFKDANPVFDRSGEYLYFLGDRNVGMNWDAFDFQMDADPPTKIMMVALTADAVNPFAEKVDEEGADKKPDSKEDKTLIYDLAGAADRVMNIPGVVGSLGNLIGGDHQIWWNQDGNIMTWDMKKKKPAAIAEGVGGFELTADGKKIGAMVGGKLFVGDADSPLGGKPVNLAGWRIPVEPVKEWRQILREGWRYIRDNFYDPQIHGANWPQVWSDLSAQLPAVADREDLNDLIGQMQGSVRVSHMFHGGGYNQITAPAGAPGFGMLGCDYEWAGGGLKITRLFRGDGFEDGVTSPLLAAPASAREGEYIVALDGVAITANVDPLRLLESKGGQLVRVRLNSKPGMEGSREVWIRAMKSDGMARYYDWVNWNRDYVTSKGGVNLAYIHLPDMQEAGMAELTKHLYANLDKDGLVLDVRYNGGGITSGMVLERLRRVIFEYDQARFGAPVPYHRMGFNSKVIIVCNEMTGSDGEYFSTGFRMMKLGTSVGKRTWGGFMAVGGVGLIDGGFMSCPVQGSFPPGGDWLPDGFGFKPDHEVDIDPVSFNKGRDPQLDKAIELIKSEIKRDPPKRPLRPKPVSKYP